MTRLGLLLVLTMLGCSFCRAPKRTDCPPGIDCAAFLDATRECVTIDPVVGEILLDTIRLGFALSGAR